MCTWGWPAATAEKQSQNHLRICWNSSQTFSMSFCECFQPAFTLGVPRRSIFWWNNSESRMLQDDGSQALLLNPHCLVDCLFMHFSSLCWLQTWQPRCPFAGRVYWWADAHDTCSRKQARTFRSPAWFASDVDAWSILIGFLGQIGHLQTQGGSNVSDHNIEPRNMLSVGQERLQD